MFDKLLSPSKTAIVTETVNAGPVNREDYLALAARAGFTGAAEAMSENGDIQRAAAFRAFLAEAGHGMYSGKAVIRYMNHITPPDCSWHWVTMRSYRKPIPVPVLMAMATIREAYPEVLFEITDIYYRPKGDPFLRCSIDGGSDWIIIERWDEPSFRG
jgi:hypothetical protein